MHKYFSDDALLLMRHEIEAAAGNEVFFIGRANVDGIVFETEAIARGSKQAVPAILTRAACGDVVIHNHPSGDPAPSSADISVTRNLRQAAQVMSIDLLDHIVVGTKEGDPAHRGWYSFREAGLL